MSSTSSTDRSLTAAALALAGVLVLSACGGGDDTATSGSEASSTPSTTTQTVGNDADVAFLTGMKPHHEQAVEMSQVVLAADPPTAVADLARRVQAAQAPEIEQMDAMMAELGHSMDEDHMGDGPAEHGGMMSDADMAELMDATGTDAARTYLESMIEHHQGAIDAAEREIADGEHEPAIELARTIAEDQAAEIAEMQALLADL